MMFVSTLLSAVIQVAVLTLIPWLVYVTTRRKLRGFAAYVGLKGANSQVLTTAALIGLVLALAALWVYSLPGLRELALDPASQLGRLRALRDGAGVWTLLWVALLQAVIQTSLSEEIFFRGFVAKRLIAWRGFALGNLLQALIFGAVHLALFATASTQLTLTQWLLVFLLPAVNGWISGYLNERAAGGSIVPGWTLHAVGNTVSFVVVPLTW